MFPTYRCNLKCGYCTKALVEDPPELLNELSDARLLDLVDEGAAMGVEDWFIGGGGEPMLRRDLVMAMIEKIRALGMNGTLQTNGTRFRTEDLERIVESGWGHLSVSLDGATAEVNDTVRFKRTFDRIVGSLQELNRIKIQHSVAHPKVRIVCVITAQNYQQLAEMVELCHSAGSDDLRLVELYVNHDGMDSYVLDDAQRAAMAAALEAVEPRAEELGVRTNIGGIVNTLTQKEAHRQRSISLPTATLDSIGDSMCFEPFLSLSIVSSGVVSPCCVFWEGNGENIKDCSLSDVWYGPYMEKLRKDILLGVPPTPCVECHFDMIRHTELVRQEVSVIEGLGRRYSAAPYHLLAKAASSVRRNGVGNSLKRGAEWLKIRASLKRRIDASAREKPAL